MLKRSIMKMMRTFLAVAASIALLHVNSVSAITISDSASGSPVPGLLDTEQNVDTALINGDFTINKNNPFSTALRLGNGVDEVTTWSFDFNADPNLAALLASNDPLTSALLTLHLTQRNRLIDTDTVTILGALPEPDPANPAYDPIQGLTPVRVDIGDVSVVQIDLTISRSRGAISGVSSSSMLLAGLMSGPFVPSSSMVTTL